VNPALVISPLDNVATALEPLERGRTIRYGDATIALIEAIPRGHKVALRPIASGEAVVKYGNAIGTASSNIAAGAHVHTHNVASARGRGDLASGHDTATMHKSDQQCHVVCWVAPRARTKIECSKTWRANYQTTMMLSSGICRNGTGSTCIA
jgi:altronate dehydratase small subunit